MFDFGVNFNSHYSHITVLVVFVFCFSNDVLKFLLRGKNKQKMWPGSRSFFGVIFYLSVC